MMIHNTLDNQYKVTYYLNHQAYVIDPQTKYTINSQTPDLLGTIDVNGQYIGTVANTTNGNIKIIQGVGSPGIYLENLN